MPSHDGFYSSKPWFKVRAQAMKRDGYRCRMCSNAVAGPYAASVDHILPRRTHKHLELSLDNLQTLCKHCHDSIKQKHESNPNMKQVGLDGYPVGTGWE